MRFKTLLIGSNETLVETFFVHMSFEFDSLFCSSRYEDVENHIKYVDPDLITLCISNEPTGFDYRVSTIKMLADKKNIPMVLIGSQEECAELVRKCPSMSEALILYRPIVAAQISSAVVSFMEHHKKRPEASQTSGYDITLNKKELMDFEKIRKELDLELSVLDGDKGESKAAASPEVSAPSVASVIKPPERKHILVVDDDPLMLKLIKGYLEADYDVAVAKNGKLAYRFLNNINNTTDLVLLDYEMPGEKGPEVLEKIRDNSRLGALPVLFLTGVKEKSKVAAGLAYKPQGYLLKPIDRDTLLTKVREVLQ